MSTIHKFTRSLEPIESFDGGDDDYLSQRSGWTYADLPTYKPVPCFECEKMAEMQKELDELKERLDNFVHNSHAQYVKQSKEYVQKRYEEFEANHPGLLDPPFDLSKGNVKSDSSKGNVESPKNAAT